MAKRRRIAKALLAAVILIFILDVYYSSRDSASSKFRRKSDSACSYCIDIYSLWNHNAWNDTFQSTEQADISCQSSHHIVFLKTHKTGSSTVTSILQRFGFLRNLTFAIPPRGGHIISLQKFNRRQVLAGTYDLIVNHVRYNRIEMESVTNPDSKYITIIRDPATQLESVFGYFQLFRPLHLSDKKNPYSEFISRPQYYLHRNTNFGMRSYLRNPLLYDLGLDREQQLDVSIVNRTISKLAKEFDLVMLQEYFNESLLLLKKLLCWEWDDIIYLTKGERIKTLRYAVANDIRKKTRKWCASDVMLYDYFNATFWEKVKNYGPEFETDLKILESKLNETKYNCTLPEERPNVKFRAYEAIPNPGANTLCRYMLKSDRQFTQIIRAKQEDRLIKERQKQNHTKI
ncbi:galactosylceramide sulfotransferase-like [Anneissia japonica]|uniref:galactosylceramide sulfotransferase-like n=1 Tax=Anneissia japonica TaxID=1529436 RepID=UPI001425800F|nr:galactosylceramide sulfotransferase-like [Anneissia japonica]